ncbi:hypothetical protein TNCV_1523131 [Trichonephila clavipes]|nr:hypothetical protein TNCV_1523131 [Trichonephila clavipes]
MEGRKTERCHLLGSLAKDRLRNRLGPQTLNLGDYTGMWVRRGSTNLMDGKVVFLRGLLSPIRVVDLTVMNPLRILFEVVRSALKARTCHFSRLFPSYVCQKNFPPGKQLAARGHPPSTPFLSDKYHPCKF